MKANQRLFGSTDTGIEEFKLIIESLNAYLPNKSDSLEDNYSSSLARDNSNGPSLVSKELATIKESVQHMHLLIEQNNQQLSNFATTQETFYQKTLEMEFMIDYLKGSLSSGCCSSHCTAF